MTEKVKVTQEQFDWLEKYKSDKEINYAIDIHPHKKRPDSPIADWMPSEVARALYNGYETEPEFKKGDWVARLDGKTFYPKGDTRAEKVLSVEEGRTGSECVMHGEDGRWGTPITHLRHATPEEIKQEKECRVWAKIKREVGEFRVGDAYEYADGDWGVVVSDEAVQAAKRFYREGRISGILPAESFISFEDGESNGN